jgi:hypothetical protein
MSFNRKRTRSTAGMKDKKGPPPGAHLGGQSLSSLNLPARTENGYTTSTKHKHTTLKENVKQ